MAAPTCDETLADLRALADPAAREGMGRYGINVERALGVSIYRLRPLARSIGTAHELAVELWETGVHEARMLAGMIADPARADDQLLERWVADIDSWDLCDQTCGNLFVRTALARRKIADWTARPEEFVKRAGFALICELAAHDRSAPDEEFLAYLPLIAREAADERRYVMKAVNWALRNIGKRNRALNAAAIAAAGQIREQGSRSARWIAADALRELTGEKVQARLARS